MRKATLDDRAAIQQLIAESARGLSRADYTDQQIETAIATVFGFDSELIRDNTYFVAESVGEMAGCGGWSKRMTLFGGDQYTDRDSRELDPNSEPARIRAFFVHPEFARQGIGRAILNACESEAKLAGFQAIELMATLPGVKLYQACGYVGGNQFLCPLTNEVTLELVPMRKVL